MKKIYWMGLLATLLLGGCSEEDGLNSGNGGNELLSEQAYLTVRIMDAGANTKATEGNPEFEDGTPDDEENKTTGEHHVEEARFFFYALVRKTQMRKTQMRKTQIRNMQIRNM